MWQQGELFRICTPYSSNKTFGDVAPIGLAPEFEYYCDLLAGKPLPETIEIDLEDDGVFRRLKNHFVPFGDRLLASDRLHVSMKEMLATYCNTIKLVAPFGEFTYYLPRHILEAVDIDESNAVFSNDEPRRLLQVNHLVLLETATRDVPIFRIFPPEYSSKTFVNAQFMALYRHCKCKGIRFAPVEVSPWWEAYM